MRRPGRTGRFVLTPAARDDLTEISDYLRRESPAATRRVRAELREAMRRLAALPGTGHLREELTDAPLRFWSVYSYLVVYDPETDPLQIVRVLHGARDLRRLLEGEE